MTKVAEREAPDGAESSESESAAEKAPSEGPEPIRILEVGNYPPPRCGWSMRIKYLADELRNEGADCVVLDIGPSRKVRRPGCVDVQNGIDYVRKLVRFAGRGYRFHLHANGDSPKGFVLVLLGLVVSSLFGRPSYLTFHAGPQQEFFPRHTPFWELLFRSLFGWPEAVICNDASVKTEIVRYGVDPAKIECIPAFSPQYVAESSRPSSIPSEIRQFRDGRDPVLVCYAYDRPEFMLDNLFHVIGELAEDWDDLGLLMLGETDVTGLERKARQAGVRNRVLFAGNLDHGDFLAALGASDVYVRTHLRDGVSSSVLEALALGTPVVAARNPCRPEEVTEFEGEDRDDLHRKLRDELRALEQGQAVRRDPGDWEDTLSREVALLCS